MAFILVSWTVDALIALAAINFLVHLYLSRHYKCWKNKGIAYVKPVPFFGNFLAVCLLRTSVGEILHRIYNSSTKERCVGFFVFDEPCLLVRSPTLANELFVKNFDSFCDRNTASNENDDPIAANMMFSLKNPAWKVVRSKLTPFFSSGNLKRHAFTAMNELGKQLSEHISHKCQTTTTTNDCIEAKDLAIKYSTDLISNAAFGIAANCISVQDSHFRTVTKKLIAFNFSRSVQILVYFFMPKLVKPFKIKFFDPSSVLYFKNALWNVIQERSKNGEKRSDLIDIFLKARNRTYESNVKFDDDVITGQSALIFLAGYEPMSAAISYALYQLSFHQNMQQRLRKEIRSVLEKHDGELTYDGLKEMVYAEMVILEIFRLYPMLSFIQRQCVKDYQSESGVVIEKGTAVYFSLFGIHSDAEYFPEPEKFDPERFSKMNKQNIIPYSFVPFGIGPHKCIGERFGLLGAKVGLIHIISNFIVSPTEFTPVQFKFEPLAFILTPICDFALHFQHCP